MVIRGPIKDVYFGFSLEALLVRVDFDSPARVALADFDTLRVGWVEPPGWEVLMEIQNVDGRLQFPLKLAYQGQEIPAPDLQVGVDQIVELAIPFARLGIAVDQPIQFYVELLEGRQSRDRAPREGTINLACPSPNFEQIMWNV
jgi:hypothetical protein